MKTLLIILIIIIIVLFSVWWLGGFGYTTDQPSIQGDTGIEKLKVEKLPSQNNATVKLNVIEITDAGFKPSSLDVKGGDTVKFVNRDSKAHWPASGTHPTHELCPGFDALRGLAQGEEYSYTFNFEAPKTCPFHDHLRVSLRGMINIAE